MLWHRIFYQTQDSSGMGLVSTRAAAGYKVLMSFRPNGTTWEQIAAGNEDTRWANIGTFLGGIPNAGAWCFNHEPENDRATFGSNANGDAFSAAFDQVASVIKPLAPNWLATPVLFDEVFPSFPFGRGGNWVATPDPNHWIPSSADMLGVDYYSFRGANDSVHWVPSHTRTITNAIWSGGVATYTTSTAHANKVGCAVNVTGVTPSGYNGNREITSTPTTTTFTVGMGANPGTYSSGGTSASGDTAWSSYNATAAIDDFLGYATANGIGTICFPEFGSCVTDPSIVNEDVQRAAWIQGVADAYRGDARVRACMYFEVNEVDNAAKGNYSITDPTTPPQDNATVDAFISLGA